MDRHVDSEFRRSIKAAANRDRIPGTPRNGLNDFGRLRCLVRALTHEVPLAPAHQFPTEARFQRSCNMIAQALGAAHVGAMAQQPILYQTGMPCKPVHNCTPSFLPLCWSCRTPAAGPPFSISRSCCASVVTQRQTTRAAKLIELVPGARGRSKHPVRSEVRSKLAKKPRSAFAASADLHQKNLQIYRLWLLSPGHRAWEAYAHTVRVELQNAR